MILMTVTTSIPEAGRLSATNQKSTVTVEIISALPIQSKTSLRELLEADPVIGRFLVYWDRQKPPTQKERSLESSAVTELVVSGKG